MSQASSTRRSSNCVKSSGLTRSLRLPCPACTGAWVWPYLGRGDVFMACQEFQSTGRATEIDPDLQELCLAVADLYEGIGFSPD